MQEQIWSLLEQTLTGNDDTEKELAIDLAKAAYKYTQFRVLWNFYSIEEKAEQDRYRTSAHNAYMDCLRIFLRYEQRLGKSVPNITESDRKTLGDIGNYLTYKLAVLQR